MADMSEYEQPLAILLISVDLEADLGLTRLIVILDLRFRATDCTYPPNRNFSSGSSPSETNCTSWR